MSGDKVRVCYHLCIRHARKSHIALFILKKNDLLISYHTQCNVVIIKQFVFCVKHLSTFRTLCDNKILEVFSNKSLDFPNLGSGQIVK